MIEEYLIIFTVIKGEALITGARASLFAGLHVPLLSPAAPGV